MIPDVIRILHKRSEEQDSFDFFDETLPPSSSFVKKASHSVDDDYNDFDVDWSKNVSSAASAGGDDFDMSNLKLAASPDGIRQLFIRLGRQLTGDFFVETQIWDPAAEFSSDLMKVAPWIAVAAIIGFFVGLVLWAMPVIYVKISTKLQELRGSENPPEVDSYALKGSSVFPSVTFTPKPNFKNRKSKRSKGFGISADVIKPIQGF